MAIIDFLKKRKECEAAHIQAESLNSHILQKTENLPAMKNFMLTYDLNQQLADILIETKRAFEPKMIDEKDIYRSAMLLINKHGDDAREQAALMGLQNADRLDAEGLAVWCRIVDAIATLQNNEQPICKN